MQKEYLLLGGRGLCRNDTHLFVHHVSGLDKFALISVVDQSGRRARMMKSESGDDLSFAGVEAKLSNIRWGEQTGRVYVMSPDEGLAPVTMYRGELFDYHVAGETIHTDRHTHRTKGHEKFAGDIRFLGLDEADGYCIGNKHSRHHIWIERPRVKVDSLDGTLHSQYLEIGKARTEVVPDVFSLSAVRFRMNKSNGFFDLTAALNDSYTLQPIGHRDGALVELEGRVSVGPHVD
jgi:hypothetical protein